MMDIPKELVEYKRVLQKANTPDSDEFSKTAMIAAGGVVLIGIIGLTIYGIMSLVPM